MRDVATFRNCSLVFATVIDEERGDIVIVFCAPLVFSVFKVHAVARQGTVVSGACYHMLGGAHLQCMHFVNSTITDHYF